MLIIESWCEFLTFTAYSLRSKVCLYENHWLYEIYQTFQGKHIKESDTSVDDQVYRDPNIMQLYINF